MVEKATVKVLFSFDDQGWIVGYQSEFFDGTDWQTPFDVTNAVDVAPADLETIVIGATKLIDGQLVLDTVKQAEIEAEANKVVPTAEQQLISTLMLKVAKLEAGA